MMPLTEAETSWIAGLLEGEGWFGWVGKAPYTYPGIQVAMTDEDVVERLHRLTGCGTRRPPRASAHPNHKPVTVWRCSGEPAADLMRSVHRLMGTRRGSVISGVLEAWAKRRPLQGPNMTHCRRGHEYTEQTTYYRPDGAGKACKKCAAAAQRRRKEQRRA